MIIKTMFQTISPSDEPVLLVFNDDQERLRVIEDLSNMRPQLGPRIYAISPINMEDQATQMAKSILCNGLR